MKLPKLLNTPVSFLSRVLVANANISTNILLKNILYSFLFVMLIYKYSYMRIYGEKNYIRIYRQYATEEGYRSVRKLWSFYWIKVSQLCFMSAFCL